MKDRIGYTEFSFGYAFTENLIRWSATAPATAPHFPNLVQEGQLGYDVAINLPAYPLFFQFKLPELMVRETAKEIATFGLPLHCDFFRMALMRRDSSSQHQLLIDLETSAPGAVFYASGMMADIAAFNAAYGAAQVHIRSALFSPGDIGPLPDNLHHVVSYNDGATHGWYCSEPRKIALTVFDNLLSITKERLREARNSNLEEVLARTRQTLQALSVRRGANIEDAARQRFRASSLRGSVAATRRTRRSVIAEEVFVTREIARIGFGLEMLIAQP